MVRAASFVLLIILQKQNLLITHLCANKKYNRSSIIVLNMPAKTTKHAKIQCLPSSHKHLKTSHFIFYWRLVNPNKNKFLLRVSQSHTFILTPGWGTVMWNVARNFLLIPYIFVTLVPNVAAMSSLWKWFGSRIFIFIV